MAFTLNSQATPKFKEKVSFRYVDTKGALSNVPVEFEFFYLSVNDLDALEKKHEPSKLPRFQEFLVDLRSGIASSVDKDDLSARLIESIAALESDVANQDDLDAQLNKSAAYLAEIITGWDVVDPNGNVVPVTEETILLFISCIHGAASAIGEAYRNALTGMPRKK